MIESTDPKITEKPSVRCSRCDREVEHYNMFLTPENEQRAVCSECVERKEKGFNAHRDFRRQARSGYIPR
jgi:hypothetical protein